LGANGSTLSLVAPLFTVSVIPGEFGTATASEGGVALLPNFPPGTGPGAAGQGLRPGDAESPQGAADEPAEAGTKATEVAAAPSSLPVWERVAMGLERAWEQVRSELLQRAGLGDGDGPVSAPARTAAPEPAAPHPSNRVRPRKPAPPQAGTLLPSEKPGGPRAGGASPGEVSSVGVTDAAIAALAAEGGTEVGPSRQGPGWWDLRIAAGRGRLALTIATAAAMASAATVAWAIHAARGGRRVARGASRPLTSAN
jgi:hypothetical protein